MGMTVLQKLSRGSTDWPIFDLSTVSSIESLMRGSPADPWGERSLSDFTDFFVYSDSARFILPHAGTELDVYDNPPEIPTFLRHLVEASPGVFGYEPYSTTERRILRPQYTEEVLKAFERCILPQRDSLRTWTRFYRQRWVRGDPRSRIAKHYVFDVDGLRGYHRFAKLKSYLGLEERDLLWALDVALRYPLYGSLAGKRVHYLAHPLRSGMRFPTQSTRNVPPPTVPVRFGPEVVKVAKDCDARELADLLARLRDIAWELGVVGAAPGSVEREVLRKIASEMAFSAKLHDTPKLLAVVGGVVSTLGAALALGPPAALIGGAISVASAIWDGKLPRKAARPKFLRPQ